LDLLLNSGDVLAVTGIPQTTLDRWCDACLVNPVNNKRGQGKHRRFTVVEATALAYGNAWRQAGVKNVCNVVKFIANMSQDELERHITNGYTFLFAAPGFERLVEPPFTNNLTPSTPSQRLLAAQLDLGLVYGKVRHLVEKLHPAEALDA
jgi:hypothetical protein